MLMEENMQKASSRLHVELAGYHALVTGGGGGIGRACAFALARSGTAVTVLDLSASAAAQTVEALLEHGVEAAGVQADVRDEQQVDDAIRTCWKRRPLDMLVNAAGLNRTGPAESQPFEDFRLVMDVNVLGTVLCCRAYGREALAAGRTGSIVNITSQMGSVGYPDRSAYCCSKHAVNGYTKALGVEWAERGIRVNAVAPTFIETPLTKPMFEDGEFLADVMRRMPMRRIGSVDEVADAVLYLASPAASLVTGCVLAIDGGWTAW